MLPNSIVVASGRSGTGASSLVANVAGVAASSGWRVLVVDLDPSATLGSDLGYLARADNDQGRSLYDAVVRGSGPVVPVRAVRPGLDAVSAGLYTSELAAAVAEMPRHEAFASLDTALAELVRSYDLVLFDTPTVGTSPLADVALAAGRFLVTPTPAERMAMIGLLRTLELLRTISTSGNPALRLLGIVLFGVDGADTERVCAAREQLYDAVGARAPIFDTCVRPSPHTAEDCRAFGLLAHEHQTAATDGQDWLIQGDLSVRGVEALATGDRPGLADDYYHLAREILSDYRAQVESEPRMVRTPTEV